MRRLTFIVGLGFALIGANAQTASPELISSSGDSFINATYQLDWSVGECIIATHSAGDYVITQGFHQNTYIITLIEDLRADIEMTIFPNPTGDIINLQIEKDKKDNINYSVLDFSGKVLQTTKMNSDMEQINFSNYALGNYFIQVSQNNQLIKSFKIIKQ